MNQATQPSFIASFYKTFSKSPFNLILLIGFTSLFIAYASKAIAQEQLAQFSIRYADFTFLSFILFSIARQLKKASSIVDPIYWLLLGSAFSAWFVLTLLRFTILSDLAVSTQDLIVNICYFLHFSLMIAAIEVKGYEKADQLLTKQSILIWIASFIFVLGAFILLVLTASNEIKTKHYFDMEFIFYILMDVYLLIRWWHLAWTCRKTLWVGYFLFGCGTLMFAIADVVEAMSRSNLLHINSGDWSDWVWYIPYFFIYIALQYPIATSQEQNISRSFSRTHLFNSPLLFTAISLFLIYIVENNPSLFGSFNQTQLSVIEIWLVINLVLTLIQFTMLIREERIKNRLLIDADITNQALQQRMLQQALTLENQSASNKAILETTHNAIFTLNAKGKILSCNPAACNLSGYSAEQLIGSTFVDMLQAEGELARFFSYQSYRQKLMNQSEGIEIQSTITCANNEHLPVHATLSQDKNNKEGLLVVSLVNIKEQKMAEQEAHQLKDQFTANISHEFRTPLTIINGVLDNLLTQEKYTTDMAQLKTAKRNGLRMVRMVEQLLELSRIANNSVPISAINSTQIAQFVCSSFEEIASNNEIAFHYELNDNAWVMGNAQAFEKILFNLLSNAFKYTQQGSVNVTLSTSFDEIELRVKDTGIGISVEQQALIFERFHRVDNKATQTVHGVGIGLALVKELCDTMLWDLKVESTPNEGSVFILHIPKAAASSIPTTEINTVSELKMTTDNTLTKSIESEIVDARSRGNQTPIQKSEYSVLIVEDNYDMQAHIKDILSPYHQCLLANNGEEGVRLAIDYVPDIIVSDVMMPGISGFDLLKTLKKTEMTTHIPIILLTARSDSASKIRGLEAQADDYLSKPFDAQELLLRVNNQLNSRQKLQLKLNSMLQQTADKEITKPVIEDKFIIKLEAVFAKHYQNSDFSMHELANLLAMSERQLQRKIKALLGVNPLETLKQFRLKEAKKQIEAGDQLGVIAQSCGFSSQSYFGRCFKEQFGMTPKAFQQSLH